MFRGIQIKPKWKIFFTILLIAPIVLLNGCGENVQKKQVYRVGIISGVEAFADIAYGFKFKMKELVYVEGENIVYDFQKLNADPVGEKRVAQKFVRDKVDLIFAFPTEPAVAAKVATQGTDIPVVFAMAGIEDNDLVESVAKPGGNITGVRYPGPELTVKRLDILHELVPQAKRILITYDPNYPTIPTALSQLRPAALSKGLALIEEPVSNLEELQAALQKRAISADIGIDAILIMPEILTQSPDGWAIISKFAAEHKLPIAGSAAFEADSGALFSYIPNLVEIGRLSAILVDKIFKGTQAGTIMVVTPNNQLRLNYKVIQDLGLNVGEGLLSMADEIIR